jgi:hypothetical protein
MWHGASAPSPLAGRGEGRGLLRIVETAMSNLRETTFAEAWTAAQHLRGSYLRLLFSRRFWSLRKPPTRSIAKADAVTARLSRRG